MRSFWRVLQGQFNLPLMTEIMRNQEAVFASGAPLPHDAKKMALGIMQVNNGLELVDASLHRVEHNAKMVLVATPEQRYVSVLSGQLLCMIGDECPPFNAGEVWWLASEEAVLINKSGDDAIILDVIVKAYE
jgi:hypothetical protein